MGSFLNILQFGPEFDVVEGTVTVRKGNVCGNNNHIALQSYIYIAIYGK